MQFAWIHTLRFSRIDEKLFTSMGYNILLMFSRFLVLALVWILTNQSLTSPFEIEGNW